MSLHPPGLGGGGGGEFRLLVEEPQTIIMQGEGDTYDLPDPPSGKKYQYIIFDFLTALGTLTDTIDDIDDSVARTSGQYICDATGNRSAWYRSLHANNEWFSGGTADLQPGDQGEDVHVGIVFGRRFYLWTIVYNFDQNILEFQREGQSGPTDDYNPIVYGAMITAFVVDQ